MVARRTDEEHRVATPLELFFDLCFVVAVAQAARTCTTISRRATWPGLVGYPMVFFAIWWAWMNFTWFASAYDNDDVLYRLVDARADRRRARSWPPGSRAPSTTATSASSSSAT